MKIMLFHPSHLPHVGGREVVVHQLAISYLALGHEVIVVGPGGYRTFRKFKYAYRIIRWPRIPFLPREWYWIVFLLIAQLQLKCDIIHAHTAYPSGYIAARLKSLLHCPVIITPHGEDIHVVPELEYGRRLEPHIAKKIRHALNTADYSTAISKAVAVSLEDAGAKSEKIVSIPNGVDIERFCNPIKLNANQHLGFPADSKLIVSVGNYRRIKGHEELVSALHKARETEPRLRLVIVGTFSPKLCKQVSDDGLDDYVTFLGKLPLPLTGEANSTDILAGLLQSSIAYVSSSITEGTEGLSLAILEAMAAKTCVIATNISGSRDILVNGQNGLLIKPGSITELATAISKIAADEPLRNRLAAEGQESIQDYSWSFVAEKYLRLFEKTLTSSSAKNQ